MKDSWASFSTRKLKGKNRLELLFFLLNSIVAIVVVVIMMVIIIIIVAILDLILHQEDIMRLVAARREW